MKEQLLHFIWQYKLFNTKDLQTTHGTSLQILDFGRYNKDAGPDFWNAKIKIDDIILVGNIELHINASDWITHKHNNDKKYNNVILHVVYNDGSINIDIPTLQLNGRIPPILLERYENMMQLQQPVICLNQAAAVDDFTVEKWKERLLIQRLERKSDGIFQELQNANNDWEHVTYTLLGKYFGSHINKEAFEQLTHRLDYKILLKHADNLMQIEALLLGTAGLLNKDFVEQYAIELKREYHFLKHKYQLQQMPEQYWQLLRIRPISFPTIRIAWFAQLLQRFPLFQQILKNEIFDFLEDISGSEFWETHYVLDKISTPKNKKMGKAFKDVLKINVFAPLLYAYGKYTNDNKWIDKSILLLSNTQAEANHKLIEFTKTKWTQNNAFDTQAMMELYDQYCTQKKCLECSIGHKILKQTV
ncbi:MAG TPA: DUF2851 family protein [Chitinophagales bacterium]|nr:DUF2851 family protein [Chitinophagales bacterium]